MLNLHCVRLNRIDNICMEKMRVVYRERRSMSYAVSFTTTRIKHVIIIHCDLHHELCKHFAMAMVEL